MSELKKLAIELYKPPFRHIHGYIYDADSCMVADDSALRVRGWGRIQYMDDAEALQDAAGELIAEALTEYWQRRTQPEATAPAQDLSAAILNLQPEVPNLMTPNRAYRDGFIACRTAAAALASSANALSAGDRVDAGRWRFRQKFLLDGGAVLWSQRGCQYRNAHGVIMCQGATEEEAIDAAILQSQKGGQNG